MDQHCTLLVRHLPAILSRTETEDLLRHFGSRSVYVFPSKGPMRSCATALFSTREAAVQALHRLHQLEIFGRRLVVEFAHSLQYSTWQTKSSKKEEQPPKSSTDQSLCDKELTHVASNNSEESESHQQHKQQHQQLCYLYPPPSPAIVSNIAHALSCVPSFYEQVLHLMNKMNLPAPFCQPPVFSMDPNHWGERQQESDDSELESEGEQPSKEVQPNAGKREAKRRKISFQKAKEAGPVSKKPLLESENPLAKKIVLNVPQELPRDEIGDEGSSTAITVGGFGSIEPIVEPMEVRLGDGQKEDQPDRFVTAEELKENRLSQSELASHPAFRNYRKGEPTTRLYIKNLAKNVTEQDLTSIYGRYIDYSSEMHKAMFNIRLMTSGRMKGQAFVGLPSEDLAEQAIKDTNGYQLKGKRIVVQFARSAKAS